MKNCASCLRAAHAATKPRIAAVAVVSPTGKAHWMMADGYTFCGKFARNWKYAA